METRKDNLEFELLKEMLNKKYIEKLEEIEEYEKEVRRKMNYTTSIWSIKRASKDQLEKINKIRLSADKVSERYFDMLSFILYLQGDILEEYCINRYKSKDISNDLIDIVTSDIKGIYIKDKLDRIGYVETKLRPEVNKYLNVFILNTMLQGLEDKVEIKPTIEQLENGIKDSQNYKINLDLFVMNNKETINLLDEIIKDIIKLKLNNVIKEINELSEEEVGYNIFRLKDTNLMLYTDEEKLKYKQLNGIINKVGLELDKVIKYTDNSTLDNLLVELQNKVDEDKNKILRLN